MIVTVLYYLLVSYVAAIMIWNLLKSRKWQEEALYILVLMPFILRLLKLK